MGRHRGAGLGGGHDEREQTLNQILVEMDGFDTNTNVIIIAATNRPDILDPALLRPGRFDRRVVLDQPDINGRLAILKVHSKGKPLADETSLEGVARQTPGFSGADLANLVNEAAILAARRSKTTIGIEEFAESIDRVIMGPERRTRVISQQEKEIVAYPRGGTRPGEPHPPPRGPGPEGLHHLPGHGRGLHPLHAGGGPPVHSKPQFMDLLAAALGGRVAEEITFGQATTGATNDLERVTQVARAMVTRYGMSERLGPRTFGKREELVFLGREIAEQRDYSERVAQEIDDEVQGIILQAYNTAKQTLLDNYSKLAQVARHLMQHEMVEGPELTKLFDSPRRPWSTRCPSPPDLEASS